jgi:hypothetical protein
MITEMTGTNREVQRPSEQEIENMLGGMRGMPSKRFYEDMADAPWYQEKAASRSFRLNGRQVAPRLWMLGAAAMVALVSGLMAAPNIEALAEEMREYFVRADADSYFMELVLLPPSQLGTQTMDLAYLQSEALRPLLLDGANPRSLEMAADRAGFEVNLPDLIPDGFILDGIFAIEGTPFTILSYRDPETGVMIAVSQRYAGVKPVTRQGGKVVVDTDYWPTGDPYPNTVQIAVVNKVDFEGESIGDVGASADVRPVMVGASLGEYVRGYWIPTNRPAIPLRSDEPGIEWRVERIWDPDAAVQTLRWSDGDYAYEVTIYGAGYTMEDLIEIGKSLD